MKITTPVLVAAAVAAIAILPPAGRPALAGTSVAAPASAAASPAARPSKPAARPAAVAPESAPAEQGPPLAAGRRLYEDAKFQQAYDLLGRALRDGTVTGDEVIEARALRARCLVKLGHRLEAKEGFKAVLRIDRGFEMDPSVIPPDEMDSFRLAAQEIDSEQLEAGRRFPASISGTFGRGNCVNQDLADLASTAGVAPADDFTEKLEFGWSVRFPLKPRLSIDFEVSWLSAKTQDKLPADRNAHLTYTSTAMPLVASLVRNLSTSPHHHLNVFVGGGPVVCQAILEAKNSLVAGRVVPSQVVGHNAGWYGHVGVEGEQMLKPRLALTGQVRVRRANSGSLNWVRDDFELYESWPASTLKDRSTDFSGVAASIGLRAYIGY